MKYFLRHSIASLLALAFIVSCTLKEEEVVLSETLTIYANHADEESTRTALVDESPHVYWAPGDAVKLFRGQGSSKVTADISSPSRSAAFSGYAPLGSGELIGLYPFSDDSNSNSGIINVSLPANQLAVEGSFAPDTYITMGKTSTNEMTFYAVCGGFRFTLSDNGVKSVVFQALGGESIAGNATVSFTGDKPEVQSVTNGFSSITITAPEGETLRPGVWYYIVAFPTALSKGYKLTFKKDDTTGSKEYNDAVSIKRGTFGSKKNVDYGVTYMDHEYVDLGLSVYWATYNVGATMPEDYGDYFAWGETAHKADYSYKEYRLYNQGIGKYTKYITKSKWGTVDNKTVLDLEDDAANVNWGGEWRTPTSSEIQELINACNTEWEAVNGVYGLRFTSKIDGFTDQSIFLPAGGWKDGTNDYTKDGESGRYWSSSLDVSECFLGHYLFFYYNRKMLGQMDRYIGHSVRPVKTSKRVPVKSVEISPASLTLEVGESYTLTAIVTPSNATYQDITWESSLPNIASVDDKGTVTALSAGVVRVAAGTREGMVGICNITIIGGSTAYPEAVDLGLSVKWASFNVGASSPEEYGNYYAWAETEHKDSYLWNNYKWCNGSSSSVFKYTSSNGVLSSSDDAATTAWGERWRMPNNSEIDELINDCNWVWTYENQVNGYRVYGKKEGYTQNSIFLPAAGNMEGTSLYYAGTYGAFWSAGYSNSSKAYYLIYNSTRPIRERDSKYNGLSIRPIYLDAAGVNLNLTNLAMTIGNSQQLISTVFPSSAPNKRVSWSTTTPNVATVTQEGVVTAISPGQALIVVTTEENGHEAGCIVTVSAATQPVAVDLGLSVEWATFNVGASSPEDFGNYFAWGETAPKDSYSWANYLLCNGTETTLTRYNSKAQYGTVDNKEILKPEDDVASVLWGNGWRMPTDDEWDELEGNCSYKWTRRNGVQGILLSSYIAGYTNNSIFLPVAGMRNGLNYYGGGVNGMYWSTQLYTDKSTSAEGVIITEDGCKWLTATRSFGLSVRAVRDKQK